ncbi:hypothetical protein HPB51_019052 [Rhipicephalus microplus]|uniref:Uncharacterized protein n=1 Tax=Rhipicephalus microplus TaxID=6941 RepID=A0A9J6D6R2_RHIMP|nr:hypothetical protein HPB51_019052 [Rhipicephalus microplus]
MRREDIGCIRFGGTEILKDRPTHCFPVCEQGMKSISESKSYAKNLDDVMLSTRREHLLSTPPRHTTQCVLPLMPRYMMCPNQEHQRPQPTTYIIAVVSRTPPANRLQWCLRGTIMGTWRLVEGLATCVRPLCAITAVFVDMWLDSVVKGVAPSNATTRNHHLLLDKTAGAVALSRAPYQAVEIRRFLLLIMITFPFPLVHSNISLLHPQSLFESHI